MSVSRQQRRQAERLAAKGEKVYVLKESDIRNMKEAAEEAAFKHLLAVMFFLPLWVCRNKLGFGKKRLIQFQDWLFETYHNVEDGWFDFNDIAATIEEETGVKVIRQLSDYEKRLV